MAKMYKLLFYLLTLIIVTLINACKSNPIVTTKFGQIKGFSGNYGDHNYEAFLGIPFAQPPLGHLRFQLPQPFNSTWSTPYEAVNFKDGCVQNPESYFNFNISEDCLYLNLWRPEINDENNSELLPVFYLMHGSGYIKKSGALPPNQGDVLAATQKIIVVNSNYRLGAFGFAHGSHTSMPGNLGIYDTLTVLRWIRHNIRSFGGDPNRVTLAGQSAGSKIASLLATLPDEFDSQSLFSRLIMMSGVATNQIHAENVSVALAKTRLLASKVNCLSQVDQFESSNELSDETIDCLKKVDASDLLKAQNSEDITAIGCSEISVFLPVYGTDLIPDQPMINHARQIESIKDKPMLFGAEQDEATLFVAVSCVFSLSDAYAYITKRVSFAIKDIKPDQIDYFYKHYFNDADPSDSYDIRSRCVKLCSDMNYNCPSLILSEFFSQENPDIHFFLNTYVGEKLAQNDGRLYGTLHGDDVKFGLGDPIRQYNLYTPNDRKFSQFFLNLFGNFTKGLNFDDWPSIAVDMNDYESLQIIKKLNLPPTNIVDHDQQICIKWAELFNYSIPQFQTSDKNQEIESKLLNNIAY
ncbi:acetylcholinesterase-1-like [Tetranychus urticae]|uniref:Carboxylic ester hydrolase n=1 Tax=Tetranychus urticae TaxID=32264 RepID=T1JSK2_TETUR|nr:acetylcholinesterase-1-like [Tetranychus urticae]